MAGSPGYGTITLNNVHVNVNGTTMTRAELVRHALVRRQQAISVHKRFSGPRKFGEAAQGDRQRWKRHRGQDVMRPGAANSSAGKEPN